MSSWRMALRGFVLALVLIAGALGAVPPALADKFSEESETKEMAEPRDDVATIYIVRKAGMGRAIYFWTFADETFLGLTRGPGYAWAYLEPGTYTFWSRAENISGVTMTVEAGETYYIWQKSLPGWGKARVRTEFVSKEKGEDLVSRVSRYSRPSEEGLAKAATLPERYLELARKKAARGEDD